MSYETYLDPDGNDCLTARQAAEHTGRPLYTIYSWERRGHLKVRMTDEQGRKVYLLHDVNEIERRFRGRARSVPNPQAA